MFVASNQLNEIESDFGGLNKSRMRELSLEAKVAVVGRCTAATGQFCATLIGYVRVAQVGVPRHFVLTTN